MEYNRKSRTKYIKNGNKNKQAGIRIVVACCRWSTVRLIRRANKMKPSTINLLLI